MRDREPSSSEPPHSGYAIVDAVDPATVDSDDDWLLRMDVVNADDFDELPADLPPDAARERLRTYFLETESSQAGDLLGAAAKNAMVGEGRRWLRLEFEDRKARPQVQVFENVHADPFRLRLAAVTEVDEAIDDELNRTGGIDDVNDASEDEIRTVLESFSHQVCFVGVLDVGQGSANALLDADGMPVAYFDVGGGVTTNRRTWPRDLTGLCFSREPVVILSHWDIDHWKAHERCEPFNSSPPSYSGTTWIVPRNPPGDRISHSHAKFLDKLKADGATVLIWPDGLPELQAGEIRLIKCTGHTRNDSGLAMTVWHHDPEKAVLLPGDADLHWIPGLDFSHITAFVAPHHGAYLPSTQWSASWAAGLNGTVMSFGRRNTYGHPDYRTLRSLGGVDWTATADRTATGPIRTGSVLLDLTGRGAPRRVPQCGGAYCSMFYSQTVDCTP